MRIIKALKSGMGLMPALFGLSIVALWEVSCLILDVSKFVLPRPSQILPVFVDRYGDIAPHVLQTTYTTIIGFVIGVAIGYGLGVMIGASCTLHKMVYPTLVGLNSIPKVAVVPVIVIWFGIGTIPAVVTSAIICIFPVVVVVSTSIATVEPELNDVLRSLGAKWWQVLLKVGIPRTMPYFFGVLKITITLAFIGSVVAETVAGNTGLGFMMIRAASNFDVILVFAGLISLASLGIFFYAVSVLVEERMVRWAFRDVTPAL